MHARAITVQTSQGKTDAALDLLDGVVDELKSKKGMREGYITVDRNKGEIMTVTVWDSEEDLRESLQFARDTFAQLRDMTDSEPDIRMLEVVNHVSGVAV